MAGRRFSSNLILRARESKASSCLRVQRSLWYKIMKSGSMHNDNYGTMYILGHYKECLYIYN